MVNYKKSIILFLSITMLAGLCACSKKSEGTEQTDDSVKEYIEQTLNLANNENQEWTYSSDVDVWVLSVVSAVAYPELPDQQGVSVTGIDTDSDGETDVTAENASDAVKGSLVIDYETKITSTNGQVYTAASAPVILNTGAAGYGSQNNSAASTSYAADGYFLLVSGNDASHGWGNAGSNGAQVEYTADGQTFDGDIAVDSISSLTMSLTNGSVYTGAVNILENEQNGSAVEDNAVITIDKGSTWNLTGNCTVTSLTNNGAINFNGYTITLADGTVLDK